LVVAAVPVTRGVARNIVVVGATTDASVKEGGTVVNRSIGAGVSSVVVAIGVVRTRVSNVVLEVVLVLVSTVGSSSGGQSIGL
jgi:hypothetical protein